MSLRTRNFLRVAILLSLLVTVICVSTTVFLIRDHRKQEKDVLRSEAAFLARQSDISIMWDDRVALKRLIDQEFRNHDGMSYVFIKRAGRPYVHTFEGGVPKALLALPDDEGNNPALATIESSQGEVLYDAAMRIGESDSTLHVGLSRNVIDRHTDGEIFVIALLGAAALVVGLFLSFGIATVTVREVDRMTKKLRESEEEYRSLFENMLNGFACCEMLFENGRPQDFVYLKVNNAFERLTGLKNVVGRKVTEVIPGIQKSNPELFEIYGRVALTGRPESFETHLETIGWLSISVHSLKKGYFVAIFENITERKKAQDEIQYRSQVQSALNELLRLSLQNLTLEQTLEQVIDQVTSLPWLASSQGVIFLADDQQETLEMAAQRGLPAPLLTKCARVPLGGCVCGQAAASGQIEFVDCVNERHEMTFDGLGPHGHYAVPILSSGKLLGVVTLYVQEGHPRSPREEDFLRAAAAVLAGVIERSRAEQELKVAAEQWNATFNSIADLVSVQDANHRLVQVNKAYAETFGKSPEQLVGRPCHEIVHGREDPWPDCPCRTVFETGKPAQVEILEPALGVYLEVSASPLFGSKGEVVGCVHIAKNITERKRAEQKQAKLLERLAEINQELKDFAYVVSHDLKAPLRAIRALADWLSADYQDQLDPQGKENLQLLGSRVDRMQNLIDGVLEYSRVGRTEQGTALIDLGRLVPEIIENLGAPEHISIQIENDLPTVEADPTRITQVFQNLLSNAIKYMDKPQGNITVAYVEEDGFWRFRVGDNGPGIEQRHCDRIFKLFQTLAPRDNRESTGVGLTIAKKIVEMYGGKIWVESEVGQGSTFFFTWPKPKTEVGDANVRTAVACTV